MEKFEEYKMLRQEQWQLEQQINSLTLFIFSGNLLSAVLSYSSIKGMETSVIIFPIIYGIILVWGLSKYISTTSHYWKTISYLEIILEPELSEQNLTWIRSSINFNKKNSMGKFAKRATHIFTLMWLLGLLIGIKYIFPWKPFDWGLLPFLFLIMLQLGSLYLVIKGVWLFNYDTKYCKEWERMKEEGFFEKLKLPPDGSKLPKK